jgi:hypothetical protein
MYTLTTVCMDCGHIICSPHAISQDTANRLMGEIDRNGEDTLYMQGNVFFQESICDGCDTPDEDNDWM